MRNSSAAKRPASSPPAPARTSRMTLRSSLGSLGSSRILSFSRRASRCGPIFSSSSLARARISGSASSAWLSSTSFLRRLYSRTVSTSGSSCARSLATCEKRARSPITSGLPRSAVSRSNLCSTSCSLSSMLRPSDYARRAGTALLRMLRPADSARRAGTALLRMLRPADSARRAGTALLRMLRPADSARRAGTVAPPTAGADPTRRSSGKQRFPCGHDRAKTRQRHGGDRPVVPAAPLMTPDVVFANPASHAADLLALLVREGTAASDPRFAHLDRALGGLLSRCAKEEEFTGKEGQQLSLHTHGKVGPARVVAIGLGKERDGDKTLH